MTTLKNKIVHDGFASEAAVAAIGNRYQLILIGSRRMRELSRGDAPKIQTKHGTAITALKEIEQGLVGKDYLYKDIDIAPRRRNKGR